MASLLELIRTSATQPLLWLDDIAYSSRLLGCTPSVWLDTAALMAYRRKAAELLLPEVTVLPLSPVIDASLLADAGLREAMAAKRRAIAPLRTLLAAAPLRARLAEIAVALREIFPASPLALTLPSPRRWVSEAYRAAFGDAAQLAVGAEETDAAAVYVAEFLRAFGQSGVDVVLLEESPESEPKSAEEIAWYQPVANLAAHYRWELGLQMPNAADFDRELRGLDFVIAPRVLPGAPTGVATPLEFWDGAAAPPLAPGGFRFARIPQDALPERVLERLAVLRHG